MNDYKPDEIEIPRLLAHARLNKVLLGVLRKLDLRGKDRYLEELKYKRYLAGVKLVTNLLNDVDYALYKFRRPIDHVSVDIDVLVSSDDINRAVKRLLSKGFRVVVIEPYTATLKYGGIVVDLYTYPAFAWAIYMDAKKILREHVEEIDVDGVRVQALTREAEVVIALAHALYKEHIYLILDHLTISSWLNRKAVSLAYEFDLVEELKYVLNLNDMISKGLVEAPCRIPLGYVMRAYARLFVRNKLFRGTVMNILKYLMSEKSGRIVLWKLTRTSY